MGHAGVYRQYLARGEDTVSGSLHLRGIALLVWPWLATTMEAGPAGRSGGIRMRSCTGDALTTRAILEPTITWLIRGQRVEAAARNRHLAAGRSGTGIETIELRSRARWLLRQDKKWRHVNQCGVPDSSRI